MTATPLPHPGETIRRNCLDPLGLSVTTAAKGLGISRKTLSALLNGHFGISPEMAIRLAKAFGGNAERWVLEQARYDLDHAMLNADEIVVKSFSSSCKTDGEGGE
ncbi:MAG: HigA family addiction module antidote protein [Cyclobacteriaceae bacterium]|nr:HigA family addiction module antidote protein [Cyclobacteriaceae bacterium]